MNSINNRLLYILFIVAGIIVSAVMAYFDILQHIETLRYTHFIAPVALGALIGFALANLYTVIKFNKKLQETANEFKYMTDNISGKFALYRYRGEDDILTYISKGAYFLTGIKPDEIIGKRWQDVVSFDRMTISRAESNQVFTIKNAGKIMENEYRFTDNHGEERYWLVHEHASIEQNKVTIHGLVEDITQLKKNMLNNQLYNEIFSHIKQAFIITDMSGKILQVNNAFSQITGYTQEEIAGKTPSILKSGKQNKMFYADMWNSLLVNKAWQGEPWNKNKNGELFCVSLSITAIENEHNHVTHYIGIYNDVTEKRQYIEQLEEHLYHDALTNLPNRTYILNKIDQMIAKSMETSSLNTVAFIDLDGFKNINDTYGHETGDILLRQIAVRLEKLIRKHDTLARLGGDEFILLLENISDKREIAPIIQRVVDEIKKPFVTEDKTLKISASIGLSVYNGKESIDTDELVRRADKAMYHVKINGKNGFQYYGQIA